MLPNGCVARHISGEGRAARFCVGRDGGVRDLCFCRECSRECMGAASVGRMGCERCVRRRGREREFGACWWCGGRGLVGGGTGSGCIVDGVGDVLSARGICVGRRGAAWALVLAIHGAVASPAAACHAACHAQPPRPSVGWFLEWSLDGGWAVGMADGRLGYLRRQTWGGDDVGSGGDMACGVCDAQAPERCSLNFKILAGAWRHACDWSRSDPPAREWTSASRAECVPIHSLARIGM